MSQDNEVENVARIVAGFVYDKVLVRPSGPKQKEEYIKNQWPFFVPVAQDIIIFLLGDEFELEEVVDHEKNGNGATPFVVCADPKHRGEC